LQLNELWFLPKALKKVRSQRKRGLKYHAFMTIKTAIHWHKNQTWNQWNRIEDPDMNPHNYNHLIFDKGAKNTWWKKDSLFNKCWCKKLKQDPFPSPCTSINSKWNKDLNIRLEILKLVWEGAGNTLELIGIGKDFLNRTPAA
jgi:hypothetical protein